MPDESLVIVGTAEDQAEADVWQAFLRAEGIPSLVKNRNPLDYLQAVIPFTPFALDVYIPRSAAGKARKVLAPSLKPRDPRPFSSQVKDLAWLWFFFGPGQMFAVSVMWPASYITVVLP